MLRAASILRLRRTAAGLALVTGTLALLSRRTDAPLGIAIVLLGVFILGHYGLEYIFQTIRTMDPPIEPGLRDFATGFISTSGLILGLLSAFGSHPFSTTVKVGIAALVADVLIGIVLVGLLLAGYQPDDRPAANLVVLIFNLALWALAFGLLCIAMALISQ